jgi:DNA-binding PadR family transcriptional regulator
MKIMRKRRGLPKGGEPRASSRDRAREDEDVEVFLPLRPTAFAVLAVLAEGAKPGVQILERLEEIGSRILGPGTLYRLMRELRQQDLILRVPAAPAGATEDERQQFHTLSALGRRVLEAESERLRRALAVAAPDARSGGS